MSGNDVVALLVGQIIDATAVTSTAPDNEDRTPNVRSLAAREPDSNDELAPLLGACANGDRDALKRLYDRFAPRLHHIALRITRQDSLAADATHDAFVQIWQQAGRFDPARGSAVAWLSSIARFRALDIRRQRRRDILGYEHEEHIDDAPDALETLIGSTDAAALHCCLAQLDEKRRRLITLAFVEGLSHSELAQRLDMPLGTVKSTIRRTLLYLRSCLDS